MKMMVLPSSFASSFSTDFSRSSNSPRYFAPASSHVEHQQALALQALGHLFVDDALRETLDDRGLAHARLADQDRIVLGAPLQDLDAAPDLVVAPDHRVELSLARALGEVERVLGERLALPFIGLRRDVFSAPHPLDRLLERRFRDAGLLQETSGLALVRGGGEQEQLGSDVLVAALLRFLVGDVEELRQLARDVHLAGGAFHLRQLLDGLGETLAEKLRIASRLADQAGDAAVFLAEEREQQVGGLDVLLVAAERQALRLGEGFLQLGGELVKAHVIDPYGVANAPVRTHMGSIHIGFKGKSPAWSGAPGSTSATSCSRCSRWSCCSSGGSSCRPWKSCPTASSSSCSRRTASPKWW
jgi:hypothetical protein